MTLPEGHYEDLTNTETNEWAPFGNEWEAEEDFTSLWDECYPEVVFGEMRYPSSRVLKAVDPATYRQELLNYVDARSRD